MASQWLKAAQKVDLSGSRGNGPFSTFLGVILHVNVSGPTSNGTSIDYFKSNPGEVTPNFQVYRDGSIVQFLPFNWQPWCQIDGNFNYGAIETGGDPDQPLTEAQLVSCAKIIRAYHRRMGFEYKIANSPGQKGLGTHQMGGLSWGGHACPGDIRAGQRQEILDRAQATKPAGPVEEAMAFYKSQADFEASVAAIVQKAVDERINKVFLDHDGTTSRLRTFLSRIGPDGYKAPDTSGRSNPA